MGIEFRPCGSIFGASTAARAIAVADTITTIFAMIFNIVGTINAANTMDAELQKMEKEEHANFDSKRDTIRTWLIFLTTVYFGIYVTYIILAVILFMGATQRSQIKLRIYLIVGSLLVVFAIGFFILHEIFLKISPFVVVAFVCFHLYKFYSFWVVVTFIKEIRRMGDDYNAFMRNLNDDEILLFEKGDPDFALLTAHPEGELMIDRINCQPFNRDYEISPDRLFVDNDTVLGSGAYGTVSRGVLTLENGKTMEVAVKTTKPNADVTYFRALLVEVKMMTFLGPHVNLVNLIGTVTTEIRQRRLWLVVELCLWNVENFLKKNRKKFRNFVTNNDQILIPDNDEEVLDEGPLDTDDDYESLSVFSTEDLLTWSFQVAQGMEFLERKKVIHGDLAARNILITKDNTVKITDFGLSRQLYSYTSYIKKEMAPLPWRFMAIESLKDMVFSSKSDAWSYGVTLWELFTLASTPYPGMSWSFDFADKLIDGLRLNKPQYSTAELYSIMLSCWEFEPNRRPTFTTLKENLKSILAKINPYDYADRENNFSYYTGE